MFSHHELKMYSKGPHPPLTEISEPPQASLGPTPPRTVWALRKKAKTGRIAKDALDPSKCAGKADKGDQCYGPPITGCQSVRFDDLLVSLEIILARAQPEKYWKIRKS